MTPCIVCREPTEEKVSAARSQHLTREGCVAALRGEIARLTADVEIGLQISGSFFEALKPLNLPAIYVANPGAHVTALIAERDAERTARLAAESHVAALRERVERVETAARKVVDGFDSGAFGRGVKGDVDPAWAIKLLPYLRALAVLADLPPAPAAPDRP